MAKKTETSQISVRAKQTGREFFTSWLLLFAMLVICVIFYIANPRVFSAGSVESMLATASMQGIVGLGLMFVMTTGVFDLAAGMKSALAASIVGAMVADGFTLGGYIFDHLGFIPPDGSHEEFTADGLHIRIEQMEDRHVAWATVTKLPEVEAEDDEREDEPRDKRRKDAK